MTFGNALSIAVSGLTASQVRARTVASNIANATTEGYSRRSVSLAENVIGVSGAGAGVSIAGIERAQAYFLTADRMRYEAGNAFSTERASAAAQLSNSLGEPGAETGLFRDYVRFETALRDAAASPESSILQAELVDRATTLTNSFRTIAQGADQQRTSADAAIGTAVKDVNAALKRLEGFNRLPAGEVTPAIADERQRLVDGINELIPVTSQQQPNGSLRLMTEGGVFLLDVNAKEVEFTPTGTVGRSQTLGNPLSGLSVNGIDITPGSSIQQSTSGKIAALFNVRDNLVPAFQDKVDGLAADLINRFSDDSVDPTKTAGEAGLFTNGTNLPPGLNNIQGTAGNLQLNALVDPQQGGALFRLRDGLGAAAPGPAGNGDQLNRLIAAFEGPRAAPVALASSGTGGAAELASEVSSAVAFEDRNAADAALFAGTRFDIARQTELESVGVDTDSEMQQLLLIEQAYAANSRVIQTVQQLLGNLLEIV
ncbi:MAG: flagellar hook-associated protein FlgK [Parvularcula sp.]